MSISDQFTSSLQEEKIIESSLPPLIKAELLNIMKRKQNLLALENKMV